MKTVVAYIWKLRRLRGVAYHVSVYGRAIKGYHLGIVFSTDMEPCHIPRQCLCAWLRIPFKHPRGDSGICILLTRVYHLVIPEKGLEYFCADPGKRGIRLALYAVCDQMAYSSPDFTGSRS